MKKTLGVACLLPVVAVVGLVIYQHFMAFLPSIVLAVVTIVGIELLTE